MRKPTVIACMLLMLTAHSAPKGKQVWAITGPPMPPVPGCGIWQEPALQSAEHCNNGQNKDSLHSVTKIIDLDTGVLDVKWA